MSFLKRIFAKTQIPEWASFLSESDYRAFVKDLRSVLESRGEPYELDLDDCCWRPAGETEQFHGLLNMSQRWKQLPTHERRDFIATFVSHTASAIGTIDFDPPFESVKEQLRLRLLPLDSGYELETVVNFDISNMFLTTLVIDLDELVQSVAPDQLKSWGFSGREKELFDLALDQTWKNESVSIQNINSAKGSEIRLVESESAYSATHALLMDRYLVPANPNGALVVIPNRHLFAFHSITAIDPFQDALEVLWSFAAKGFEEGPGSISPELFWWRDGQFTHLALQPNDQGQNEISLPLEMKTILGIGSSSA